MKPINLIMMVLALTAIAVSARPQFRSTLGVAAGHKGHYEFDNSVSNGRKRSLTPDEPQLSYTADVKPNVHSLDLEETIDSVECAAHALTLHLLSKDAVRRWGRHFYVSGGAEWGCAEGVILRKVDGVQWLGADDAGRAVVRFTTRPAQYTDVFERAHISFKQLVPDFRSELQVAPAAGKNVARGAYLRNEANMPTLGSSKMEYYDEFPMEVEEELVLDSSSEEEVPDNAKLVIHSPVDSDGFFNGDYVNFSWTYTGKVAATDYWVVALSTGKNKGVIYQSGRIEPTERQHIAQLNTTAVGNKYRAYVYLYNKKNRIATSKYRAPYYVNYQPEFMLLTPEATDVYKSGDLTTISWEYAAAFASKKITLQLCTYDDGVVSCSKKASVVASRTNYTFKCNMKKDGEYFWRLKYANGCVNGRVFAFYYTHNVKEKVYIENPTVGDEYRSGDVIPVRWAHQDFAEGEVVHLQLCKQRWGFNKCYKDYGYVDVTLGGANLLVPEGLPDSTLYYVSLRYHRSSRRWHRAESKRFAINHDPHVRFTSPHWNDVLEPGTIGATWTTDLPQTEEVYVTLRKKLPLVFDPFYLIHATHSTAVKVPVGLGQYAFDVSEGFYTPAYFTIRYNCLFGKHLCHEEASPLFTVKDVRHAGWNYDAATGAAAVSPYPLYSYSCADCERENATNLFCDVCTKWHEELDFVSQCENCYAAADFVMYDLQLDIELGAVIACTFSVNGSIAFNIGKFHNKITSEYEKRLALHLLSFPISGIPFKVAGVNVGTSFTVDVDLDTLFKYDSAVAVDAGFSRKADVWGRLEYGTTTRNGIFVGARNYEGETPTGLAVSGTAKASLGIGFKVSINADLSLICSLTVWAEPVFTPSLAFSYPAFPAKTTGGEMCAQGHYAEYAVDFDFYHGGEGKVVFPKKHYTNQSHDFSARFVEGCFLPVKSPVASLTLHLDQDIQDIFPAESRASAPSALTHEAAAAIGVSADTIYMPEEMDTQSMRFTFMSEDPAASAQSKTALKAALDDPNNEIWTKPAFSLVKPHYQSSN